jgi:hypothetical protein
MVCLAVFSSPRIASATGSITVAHAAQGTDVQGMQNGMDTWRTTEWWRLPAECTWACWCARGKCVREGKELLMHISQQVPCRVEFLTQRAHTQESNREAVHEGMERE